MKTEPLVPQKQVDFIISSPYRFQSNGIFVKHGLDFLLSYTDRDYVYIKIPTGV